MLKLLRTIFCEKPIVLELLETEEAVKIVEEMKIPFQKVFLRDSYRYGNPWF